MSDSEATARIKINALLAAAGSAAEDTLLLHPVHSTDPDAVCNDGSAP